MKGAWIGGLAVGLYALGGLLIVLLHPATGPAVQSTCIPEPAAAAVLPPRSEPAPEPPRVDGPRVVVGTATGKYGPIWGVRVTARDAATGSPLAQTETDGEGNYRIDLTGYDARVVDLIAERDASEGVLGIARRGVSWQESGELTVDFRWTTPLWTRGRVIDVTGLPLPDDIVLEEFAAPPPREGVRLFAVPADAYRRAFGAEEVHPAQLARLPKETVVTDADGRFSFPGLDPGRYRLVVGSPDRMSSFPVEFEAGAQDVRLEVVKCAGAAAWVFDAATLGPVARARLVAVFPDGRRFEGAEGRPIGLRWPMPASPLEEGPVVRVEAEGYREAEFRVAHHGAQRCYLFPVLPPNGRVVVRTWGGHTFEDPVAVRMRNPEDGPWIDLGLGPDGVLEFGLPTGPWRVEVSLPESGTAEWVRRDLRVEPDSAWEIALTVGGGSVVLVPPAEAVGRRALLNRTGRHPEAEGDFELSAHRDVEPLGVRTWVHGLPAGRYIVELMHTPWWQEVTVENGGIAVVDEWRHGEDE